MQAGNILIDDHGNVKLADYGVATSGFGSFHANPHQTFVGTPCWCARRTLIAQAWAEGTPLPGWHQRSWSSPTATTSRLTSGAACGACGSCLADQQSRSLGITLLELAHGHAPFAKYPPMKVLMMTLQNPPPTVRHACAYVKAFLLKLLRPKLEADSGERHFSRHLRDLVALCLQKDPKKRPTALALQQHKFVLTAKKPVRWTRSG